MHLLRTRIISVLIAALVLVGYGQTVFGCCDERVPGMSEKGDSHSGDHVCQCLCHQIFLSERIGAPVVSGTVAEAALAFPELAATPPDTIPLGIDHPPQLR